MKHNELLSDFLNSVVTGDDKAAKNAFSLYCSGKAKAITVRESANKRLVEAVLTELKTLNMKTLDMDGDKILVNGKPVGRVSTSFKTDDNGITDVENDMGGIDFTSDDGTFSKEFDDMDSLFKWLRQRYLGE